MGKIEKAVSKLLKDNRVFRPPVPVEKLAETLGLQLRLAPLKADVSGAILRSDDAVVIGVNSLHHPNRQRFTIAHEIAHYLLHKGFSIHIDRGFRVNLRDSKSSEATDSEEIEANRFAAELLMPADFLIKDATSGNDEGDELVHRLAERYRVSSQAMQIRLANLGFIDPI